MKDSIDLTIHLYEQKFRFQDNSRFHWPIQKKVRKDMKEEDYEKLILDGIKIRSNLTRKLQTIFILVITIYEIYAA